MRANKLKFIFIGLIAIAVSLNFVDRPILVSNSGSIDQIKVREARYDPAYHDVEGLCLSGGGYRATLFSLGILWRMNEIGLIHRIERVSSVSGGSIMSGILLRNWNKLEFDKYGVATNFEEAIASEVLKLTDKTLDMHSVVLGAITPLVEASDYMGRYLDKHVYGGMTLQEARTKKMPTFLFQTTNLNTGAWTTFRVNEYSNDIIDFALGVFDAPNVKISSAVSASAAFPPFLAPVIMDVGQAKRLGTIKIEGINATGHKSLNASSEAWLKETKGKLVLNDGGLRDNLGTFGCILDPFSTIVVDARIPVSLAQGGYRNWLSNMIRTVDVIYNRAELSTKQFYGYDNSFTERAAATSMNNEERCEKLISDAQEPVFISLNDERMASRKSNEIMRSIEAIVESDASFQREVEQLPYEIVKKQSSFKRILDDPESYVDLAKIPTELRALDREVQQLLIHLGYVMADTGLNRYFLNRWLRESDLNAVYENCIDDKSNSGVEVSLGAPEILLFHREPSLPDLSNLN